MKTPPALRSIKNTEHYLGLGHTTIYNLIAQGRLTAVKLGAKTLVTTESIEALIRTMPPADVRAQSVKAGEFHPLSNGKRQPR